MTTLETFDQTPPWSVQAETAVVGACLISRDAVPLLVSTLEPRDFYREANRRIYAAVVDLYNRGEEVDVITLSEYLRDVGELDASGGFDYLASLVDAVPTAANVEYHARIVAEKATLRRLIEASRQTIADAFQVESAEASRVIAEAERRIYDAARRRGGGGFVPAKEALWAAVEKIEEEAGAGGGVTGIRTGFPTLDNMTSGFQGGDLTILAARPSMGKTALALAMAATVSGDGGATTIESLEMSNPQLVKRLLAMRAKLDLLKIRKQMLDRNETERLARAAGWVNTLPIYLDDELGGTVADLRAKVRRVTVERPVAMVVVDYLQLMSGEGQSRVQQIGSITRGLKRLAREFDTHVLALSQLSRGPESRNPPRPILSDLRDSGDIEQDADNVLLLWRPEFYFDDRTPNEQWAKWQGRGELIVAKQRNGPTGRIYLSWDKSTTTFTEAASKRDEERAETGAR